MVNGMNGVVIDVPESVVRAIRLPEAEQPARLRLELALSLYAQNLVSLGKAAELAGMGRLELAKWLEERRIPRHYSEDELDEDLRYARGE
jgi:predicted HTH domain antitoxin